jgi:hypothetical protein
MPKSFVLELHGEWSEFADECIGLIWSDRVNLRNLWVCCCCFFSRTERAAVGAVFSDD